MEEQANRLVGEAQRLGGVIIPPASYPEDADTVEVEEFGLPPGYYQCQVLTAPRGRAVSGKMVLDWEVAVDDERFPELLGTIVEVTIFARAGKLGAVLDILGVPYTRQGPAIKFSGAACLGKRALVKVVERRGKVPGQVFTNAVDLLPLDYQPETVV